MIHRYVGNRSRHDGTRAIIMRDAGGVKRYVLLGQSIDLMPEQLAEAQVMFEFQEGGTDMAAPLDDAVATDRRSVPVYYYPDTGELNVPFGGSGGGAPAASTKGAAVYAGTSYPARPSGFASVEWVGPVEPADAQDGDTWVPTVAP